MEGDLSVALHVISVVAATFHHILYQFYSGKYFPIRLFSGNHYHGPRILCFLLRYY